MTEPSVFISYSHEDAASARQIASILQGVGMKVWIDDGELLLGDSLIDKIATGIHDADFLIALVSQSSIQSNWCKYEIGLAIYGRLTNGKIKVLPVRVGNVEMPPALRDAVYLDFNVGNEEDACKKLIDHIHRHSKPPLMNTEIVAAVEVPQPQMSSPLETGLVRRSTQNVEEIATSLETGLLAKMDRTKECAVILSLVPVVPGSARIDAQRLSELRQEIMGRRVIPTSPFVDWLNIGVGQRRYLLDGGIGNDGMKFCAAELLTDGSGVFAFMVRPSSVSTPGENFVFNDEVLVSSVLGGLWLLGEHAARRAEAVGPYLIQLSLNRPDDHQMIQPGHSRGFFPRDIWRGTHPLPSARAEADMVAASTVIGPSRGLAMVAYNLVSELLQSFGMSECPQIDQQGRIRIKYWGHEFSGELTAWANKHGIEISEEVLPG